MVNSVSGYAYAGKTGDLGSEYDVQWERYKIRNRVFGTNDFKSNLFLSGTDGDVVLQRIENHVESGNESTGNGKDSDLLSWGRYLESNDKKNDILFQSADQKLYTNINFNIDRYEILDEEGFTEKLGMSWENGKPYDTFEINQNKINFFEFQFSGLGDGKQDEAVFNLTELDNARWGLQNYTIREVDTSYWNKQIDKNDYESILSHDTLRVIKQTMPNWMTNEIKEQLKDLEEGTVEYNSKFYALAIKLMDQAGEYTGLYK